MRAEGLLHLGGLSVLLAATTLLVRRTLPEVSPKRVGVAWAGCTAVVAVALLCKSPVASPWVDTFEDALEIWRMPSVYPAREARYPLRTLSRQRDSPEYAMNTTGRTTPSASASA